MKLFSNRVVSLRLVRLGIKARLAIGFGLVLALLGGTTTVALLQVRSLSEQMYNIVEVNNQRSTQAKLMFDAVMEGYNRLIMASLMEDAEDIKDQITERAKMVVLYAKAEAVLRADVSNAPSGTALLKQLDVINAVAVEGLNINDALAQMVTDRTQHETTAAIATNRLKFTTEDWLKQIRQLITISDADNAEAVMRAHATEHTARVILLAATLGALLTGVTAALLISRSIAQPIQIASRVAEAVATGNLTQVIHPCGSDETNKLLMALNSMQGGLRELVQTVRDSSVNISTASTEIAAGNQDLAHRFESTASQLQRTGSSVLSLNGLVQQSSQLAREASAMATNAANAASEGGQAFSRVVTTMSEIDQSARRIGDITGVIDGIAFQTNILALNAAVEAARAGDEGRGFAVVAGEVRNLAQRSAGAAKEIKELIGTSLDCVQAGMRLVHETGSTMTDIVASVRRVAEVIEGFRGDSEQQSACFADITEAMSQLEEVTQHNAALVEQSAAATASLVDQVQHLASAVQVFNTGSDS